MGQVTCSISVSLDGYVAGPDPGPEQPLGAGGEALHEWLYGLASWREMHGHEGGTRDRDSELMDEATRVGATIIGKRMFGGWDGPWGEPPTLGVWGESPPFEIPVFILTHHPREPVEVGRTRYTFVSDGIESALEQARAAAGDRDVSVGGGAATVQQYLRAGLLDELQLSVVPLLLGGGVRLLENLGDPAPRLERTRVVESPTGVVHVRYAVTT